jgi:hypothetical protein
MYTKHLAVELDFTYESPARLPTTFDLVSSTKRKNLNVAQDTLDMTTTKTTTPSPTTSSTMVGDMQLLSQSPARRMMSPEVSEKKAPNLRQEVPTAPGATSINADKYIDVLRAW